MYWRHLEQQKTTAKLFDLSFFEAVLYHTGQVLISCANSVVQQNVLIFP